MTGIKNIREREMIEHNLNDKHKTSIKVFIARALIEIGKKHLEMSSNPDMAGMLQKGLEIAVVDSELNNDKLENWGEFLTKTMEIWTEESLPVPTEQRVRINRQYINAAVKDIEQAALAENNVGMKNIIKEIKKVINEEQNLLKQAKAQKVIKKLEVIRKSGDRTPYIFQLGERTDKQNLEIIEGQEERARKLCIAFALSQNPSVFNTPYRQEDRNSLEDSRAAIWLEVIKETTINGETIDQEAAKDIFHSLCNGIKKDRESDRRLSKCRDVAKVLGALEIVALPTVVCLVVDPLLILRHTPPITPPVIALAFTALISVTIYVLFFKEPIVATVIEEVAKQKIDKTLQASCITDLERP
jgi:hypothetical protein